MFTNILSKVLPFIKTVGKTAAQGLKKAAQSETVKTLASDLGSTAVTAATDAGN